jgi:hypothetical protein
MTENNSIAKAYAAAAASGQRRSHTLSDALRAPLIRQAILPALTHNVGKSLPATNPLNSDDPLTRAAFNNKNKMGSLFMVGNGNKHYPGWRMLTKEEIINSECQQDLIDACKENGGWPVLEPLVCDNGLCINGELLIINFAPIVDVSTPPHPSMISQSSVINFNRYQVQKRFRPVNYYTKEPWSTTLPETGENWSFMKFSTYVNPFSRDRTIANSPTLFCRQDYIISDKLPEVKLNNNNTSALPLFKVGKFGKFYKNSGYRLMTNREVNSNPVINNALARMCHDTEWPLLESPIVLESNMPLYVMDGYMMYDGELIMYNAPLSTKHLTIDTYNPGLEGYNKHGIIKYDKDGSMIPLSSMTSELSDISLKPEISAAFSTGIHSESMNKNALGLFINKKFAENSAKNSAVRNAAAPGGGSRKSHRKQSKQRKNKRRTKKQ